MFNEKNVSYVNRQSLWNHYNSNLSQAVDVGYSPEIEFYDAELATDLKRSIGEFSAFKETSFRKDVEALMTDNGKFVPWKKFKENALKLSGDYNTRWMEAEYHQTVATANMAGKWQDFQRNKDIYPNLRYSTVGDGRVRPEHRAWDGVVKSIDDPFWKENLPPNDWGCRCNVIQTDEEETDQPTGGTQLKIEFANNPAETGKIFNKSPYEDNLTKADKKEAADNLKKFTGPIIPDGLTELEKKFGVTIDRSFLSHLNENNFKVTNDNAKGSAYDNFWKKLNINDYYLKQGEWGKKAIFYHEIGHAVDVQNGLHKNPLVTGLMNKYREKYSARKNDFYRQFNARTKAIAKSTKAKGDLDFHHQTLAADDVLMSFNSKFGSGHTKSYYARLTAPEREFLAHCFEAKYCGNKFIERVDPDLFADMTKLIDNLLP